MFFEPRWKGQTKSPKTEFIFLDILSKYEVAWNRRGREQTRHHQGDSHATSILNDTTHGISDDTVMDLWPEILA